ncbi:MAG: hypothetical protein ABIN67_13475 [Ferruginibacter sp.]
MFLSENRQLLETDGLKVYNSFAGSGNNGQSDLPVGSLTMLNEILLEAGKSIAILPGEHTIIILLVAEGMINYKKQTDNLRLVESGQVISFVPDDKKPILLQNPSAGLARFLQVNIKVDIGFEQHQSESLFDLPGETKNEFLQLFASTITGQQNNYKVFMGCFAGREEAMYSIPNAATAVFLFVLTGAFEVQHRLIEAKDGLLIWNVEQVELEALSNDAVILLIEQPIPLV